MERYVSISLNTAFLVDAVYRRIVGELKSAGLSHEVVVDQNVIKIRYTPGIEEVLWRVLKATPLSVVTSIDFK
ncbi:MAG: hypothetical protein ABWK05_08365 [Pyrobaculum sp.]